MKKILQVSAVLIAAVLMFAGCKNNADEGESLPGTWVSSLEYYQPGTSNNWTFNNNRLAYTCSDPASLNVPQGYSSTYTANVATAPQLYGVRVKIKQDAFTKAEPGIMLFLTTTKDTSGNSVFETYYSLSFYKGSYILYEKEAGKERVCLSRDEGGYANIFNDAINAEGIENEVLFYTDGDKLVLKINGTTITTVSKKLDSGKTSACMIVPDEATGSINANWEFLEFQTGK